MTLPQLVTNRYVTNLLAYGKNDDFRISNIYAKEWVEQEIACGFFFVAAIVHNSAPLKAISSVGPTIQLALKNALEKAGVTFR